MNHLWPENTFLLVNLAATTNLLFPALSLLLFFSDTLIWNADNIMWVFMPTFFGQHYPHHYASFFVNCILSLTPSWLHLPTKSIPFANFVFCSVGSFRDWIRFHVKFKLDCTLSQWKNEIMLMPYLISPLHFTCCQIMLPLGVRFVLWYFSVEIDV